MFFLRMVLSENRSPPLAFARAGFFGIMRPLSRAAKTSIMAITAWGVAPVRD